MLDEFEDIAEIAREKIQWFTGLSLCTIFLLDFHSRFTLLMVSLTWVILSLMSLFVGRVPTSVKIARGITLALVASINGLTLWTLLEYLFADTPMPIKDNWIQWVVLVLANLALFPWMFVILRIFPITRSLIISTGLVAVATAYVLVCGVQVIVEATVFEETWKAAEWEHGITHILGSVALIAWMHLIARETAPDRYRFFVPILMVYGGGYIGLGISQIIAAIFSL